MRRPPIMAAGAALALAACGGGAPEHAAWPKGEFAAAFLLDVHGSQVAAIAGPFQLRDGAVVGGEARVERTAPDPGTLAFIGLEASALSARSPLWSDEPPGEVRLLAQPESCTRGRREAHEEGSPRYHRLSALAPTVLSLDETNRFVPALDGLIDPSQLSVRVAEDPGRCLDGRGGLVPFGATSRLLEGVPSLLGRELPAVTGDPVERDPWTMLSSVADLGDGRVLAASQGAIFVFEAGAPFQDDEAHVWLAENILNPALPERDYEIVRVHLDPRSPIGGRARLLIHALTRAEVVAGRRTALAELWLGPSGFTDLRILQSGERQLQDGRFEPSGRFIGVGAEGLVVFVDPDTGEASERTVDIHGGLLFVLELSGDASRPHVVATKNTGLFIGDLEDPDRALLAPADPASFKEATAVHYSSRPDGRARVLISTYDGGYLVYEEGHGTRSYVFDFPLEAFACSGPLDACGEQEHRDRFIAMRPSGPNRVFGATYGCNAVLELNVDHACVLPLPPPPENVTERVDIHRNFRAFNRETRRTLVSGFEGTVLSVVPLVTD